MIIIARVISCEIDFKSWICRGRFWMTLGCVMCSFFKNYDIHKLRYRAERVQKVSWLVISGIGGGFSPFQVSRQATAVGMFRIVKLVDNS